MGKFNRLSQLFEDFIGKDIAGCSCSITRHTEVLYQECFGYADLLTKRPIELDTIFRIYSLTKVVTCVAALILFERGLYLLNDPLEKYLPEFNNPRVYRFNQYGALSTSPASGPIRIKNLFTMTSGLTYAGGHIETARDIAKIVNGVPQHGMPPKNFEVQGFSKALSSVSLACDPGSHWLYGLSHDILGALIEVLSGKSFSQFLKDEIFVPLGMKDTFFRIPEEKEHRLCSLYNRSADGALTKNTSLDDHFQPDAIYESGGSGLLSTLIDYSRFAQLLACGGELNGVRILSPKTIQLMSANHLTPQQQTDFESPYQAGYGYGLGVRVMIDPTVAGSNSSIGEFGWCGMAGTWVLIDPKEELSVVYMQQRIPSLEAYLHPRIRNVIYGAL